ncbi:CUB and sushi domain-containing protein 3 [Stylophora pistillata]|uniref:CUB and sushi domain-containing protein 3 n=1 Tax=Stylophora pistillata TaxID=50429 RepID=A0A2B4RTT9_STYPI|nr:CUB and sushi domain-containing protein 3 [Stylophora pistillata]
MMKFVAVIFVLALFVHDNEAWRRRRRRRTFPSCRPRNCQVSVWSQWSSCPCGSSGTRTRTRRIILPAACGGTCFFHLLESQFCKRDCQNSGTPTRNACLCPPGYLGTCCEIAAPLTTKGEMQTTTATNRTPPPRPSATIRRSRLTPPETSPSVATTSATTRTRQTAIRTEQLNPTVSTEQLPQSNATWRITSTTPRTRSTAASSAIPPTLPSASGGIHVTLPPFTGCGGILNSTSGTFATPGYPFSYSNNLNCLWTLRIPTDSVLILQFERFNTEQCCDFVELTVSTGRLARLSGSRNGFSITVRGDRSQVLNIRFTSDGSVVGPGFLARYNFIFGFPSATMQPTPSSASGVVYATSSLSSQVPTQPPFTGCGGLLNSRSGTFASPGYPFSYSNNLNCLWTLRIPTDSVLSLQFERFNTEQCCDFVELTVSTGRLARLSGSRNGFNITVRGDRSQVLNIRFTTDGSVVRTGFLARYTIIFDHHHDRLSKAVDPLSDTFTLEFNIPYHILANRVLADLLISLSRIILKLQGLIRGQITNEAFENFRNDTLQILQQAEMQLERPSNRHLGKRAIHELPDPEELAQIMDEIQRRLLG